MNAVVVYESLWGNTAAVAKAIAEGLGSGVPALTTDDATVAALEGADLIVVGSPVLGFMLPTEGMRKSIGADRKHAGHPPDLTHRSMRSWLDSLPKGCGFFAAFETRISWSPRGAVTDIARRLKRVGYTPAAEPERFLVEGTYGPLREGELERARVWGEQLARTTQD